MDRAMNKQGGIERLLDTQPMRLQGAFPQLLHRRLHGLECPQNVGPRRPQHLDTNCRVAVLIPELLARRRHDIDCRDVGKPDGAPVAPRQYEISEAVWSEQSGKAQCVLAATNIQLST